MNNDRLIEILTYFSKQHSLHVHTAHVLQAQMQAAAKCLNFCAQLLAMPDVPDKQQLIAQFGNLTEKTLTLVSGPELSDVLARLETHQEMCELLIEQMKTPGQ